jgi:hypothetical protein
VRFTHRSDKGESEKGEGRCEGVQAKFVMLHCAAIVRKKEERARARGDFSGVDRVLCAWDSDMRRDCRQEEAGLKLESLPRRIEWCPQRPSIQCVT